MHRAPELRLEIRTKLPRCRWGLRIRIDPWSNQLRLTENARHGSAVGERETAVPDYAVHAASDARGPGFTGRGERRARGWENHHSHGQALEMKFLADGLQGDPFRRRAGGFERYAESARELDSLLRRKVW